MSSGLVLRAGMRCCGMLAEASRKHYSHYSSPVRAFVAADTSLLLVRRQTTPTSTSYTVEHTAFDAKGRGLVCFLSELAGHKGACCQAGHGPAR